MRRLVSLGIGLVAIHLGGCAGNYKGANCDDFSGPARRGCQDYQWREAEIGIQQEKGNLLKAYRTCLEKYETEPPKAKEYCGIYTQALHQIELKHQTTH